MSFLWDMLQQQRINDLAQKVEGLSRPPEAGGEIERLRDRVDALTLTCMALWSILREHASLSDEALEAKVRELDLMDGVQDGKLATGPWACESCKRPNAPRHLRCMYCGHQRAASNPFPLG